MKRNFFILPVVLAALVSACASSHGYRNYFNSAVEKGEASHVVLPAGYEEARDAVMELLMYQGYGRTIYRKPEEGLYTVVKSPGETISGHFLSHKIIVKFMPLEDGSTRVAFVNRANYFIERREVELDINVVVKTLTEEAEAAA